VAVPGLELVAGADLDAALCVGRWVLDEGDQSGRHEPSGPDGCAGPGHLANLDDAPSRDHLDPSAGLRRHDLERLDTLSRVDDGFHSIALHARMLAHSLE
jgi:hypothetical protein